MLGSLRSEGRGGDVFVLFCFVLFWFFGFKVEKDELIK